MNQFNIQKIIDNYCVDAAELAKVLFPKALYPKQAFARVIKNETCLDTEQLQLLADYIGVHVSELFGFDKWKGEFDGVSLVFKNGEYTAKYKNFTIWLYKNNECIDSYLCDTSMLSVSDFIKKYKQFNSKSKWTRLM